MRKLVWQQMMFSPDGVMAGPKGELADVQQSTGRNGFERVHGTGLALLFARKP